LSFGIFVTPDIKENGHTVRFEHNILLTMPLVKDFETIKDKKTTKVTKI